MGYWVPTGYMHCRLGYWVPSGYSTYTVIWDIGFQSGYSTVIWATGFQSHVLLFGLLGSNWDTCTVIWATGFYQCSSRLGYCVPIRIHVLPFGLLGSNRDTVLSFGLSGSNRDTVLSFWSNGFQSGYSTVIWAIGFQSGYSTVIWATGFQSGYSTVIWAIGFQSGYSSAILVYWVPIGIQFCHFGLLGSNRDKSTVISVHVQCIFHWDSKNNQGVERHLPHYLWYAANTECLTVCWTPDGSGKEIKEWGWLSKLKFFLIPDLKIKITKFSCTDPKLVQIKSWTHLYMYPQTDLCTVPLVGFQHKSMSLYELWFLINQFAPGIFLVFPDTHTGLFLSKNPKKFLAINKTFFQWN